MTNISVVHTIRNTGETNSTSFSTVLGAREYVRSLLYDHTSLQRRYCEDIADILCTYGIRHARLGPFLFTITRA